jgi:hypothetical protein
MKVITLAKTKIELGIPPEDTSQDAAITAKIPIIDSKVKQITNHRYNDQITGDVTSGILYVPVYGFTHCGVNYAYRSGRVWCSGINNNYVIDDLEEYLEVGQLIEGSGIPAEAYIDEIYYNGGSVEFDDISYSVPVIKLSIAPTETKTGNQMFIGVTIGMQPTIAKGVQYLINSTSTSLPTNSLASRTLGPSSKSFSAKDQEIDNKYGMPAWFVKSFTQYQGGH